jgi:hypothetical protein
MLLVEEKEGLGSLKSLFFFFTFWNTKLALPTYTQIAISQSSLE